MVGVANRLAISTANQSRIKSERWASCNYAKCHCNKHVQQIVSIVVALCRPSPRNSIISSRTPFAPLWLHAKYCHFIGLRARLCVPLMTGLRWQWSFLLGLVITINSKPQQPRPVPSLSARTTANRGRPNGFLLIKLNIHLGCALRAEGNARPETATATFSN